MKASAPNFLAAGSQTVPKIPHPSVLNHNEACWVVERAIRTRITSTSRPDPSAMAAKLRSPSGRRSDRGRAGPAGMVGPACCVTVLTITSRSGRRASRCSWRARSRTRADLGELCCGLLVQTGGQRRIVQAREQLLAVPEQVADV